MGIDIRFEEIKQEDGIEAVIPESPTIKVQNFAIFFVCIIF
jgi:hypothetical protein